jgi:hypothetical protein
MRDPDLMQRADRAAIALEQAWERWRAMHGLGAEPLPPVSSYVGYSLEEPWGQPRVVFGLRADEAELLTSLLEGHDCVGSVYSELSARSDWRLPVSGPVSMPGRGYGGRPFGVPAQAPPPAADLLGSDPAEEYVIGTQPEDDAPAADGREDDADPGQPRQAAARGGSARARAARDERAARARRRAEEAPVDQLADDAEARWSEPDDDAAGSDYAADADGVQVSVPQSRPLVPLPDESEFQDRPDDIAAAQGEPAAAPRRTPKAKVPAQGPGYRGPRYQGSPPRYEASPRSASARADLADAADGEPGADGDREPEPARRSHVAKLTRNARRRPQGG